MKNQIRFAMLGAVVGMLAAVAPACGGPVKCTSGCVDSVSNTCRSGNELSFCGSAGAKCQMCGLGQTCNLGTCVTFGNGGGTSTGGSNGGSGGSNGGGSNGGGTAGGGSNGGGTVGGGSNGGGTAGGGSHGGGTVGGGSHGGGTVGGGSSGGGTANTCADGCFVGPTCLRNGNNTVASACGTGGQNCANCAALGRTCNATSFTCIGGTGGGSAGGGTTGGGVGAGGGSSGGGSASAGALGDSCSTFDPSACSLTPTSTTNRGFCRDTMPVSGFTYPGGMCTRRCTSDAVCGSGNFCSFFLGPNGEFDSLCYKGCDANNPCRADYGCLQISSTPVKAICVPLDPNTGDLHEFDAGTAFSGSAGSACTSDSQCGSNTNPVFACIPQTLPDGGATGYTDGYCTGECTGSLEDSFCGTNGLCTPSLAGNATGATAGPVVRWFCSQHCNDPTTPGSPTCRSGYACAPFSPTENRFDTCEPRCDNPGIGCNTAGGFTCNTATGLCSM